MTKLPGYDNSQTDVKVAVTDRTTKAVVDLTGATVEALAERLGTVVAGQGTVLDGPGGIALATWLAGTLSAGNWDAQISVTMSGRPEVVWKGRLVIEKAISAA